MKYTIKNIYKYSITVEVEAESKEEAMSLAGQQDGDHNNDDYWYDSVVISVEG